MISVGLIVGLEQVDELLWVRESLPAPPPFERERVEGARERE